MGVNQVLEVVVKAEVTQTQTTITEVIMATREKNALGVGGLPILPKIVNIRMRNVMCVTRQVIQVKGVN